MKISATVPTIQWCVNTILFSSCIPIQLDWSDGSSVYDPDSGSQVWGPCWLWALLGQMGGHCQGLCYQWARLTCFGHIDLSEKLYVWVIKSRPGTSVTLYKQWRFTLSEMPCAYYILICHNNLYHTFQHNNWATGVADGDSWLWWMLILLGMYDIQESEWFFMNWNIMFVFINQG